LPDFFQWLYELPISQTVRETTWGFPALEALHIYCMVLLVMLIAALDVRLLGLRIEGQHRQPLSQLTARVLRWAWVAFGANAITGTLLFAGRAPDYYVNSAFRVKMLLVFVALVYHRAVLPVVARREDVSPRPIASKLVGGFSLALWMAVIAASRWIAYV